MRFQVEYSIPGAGCYGTYRRYFRERAHLAEKDPTI